MIMRVETSDGKRVVNIGGSDIWYSVYSTVEVRLGLYKRRLPFWQCNSSNLAPVEQKMLWKRLDSLI